MFRLYLLFFLLIPVSLIAEEYSIAIKDHHFIPNKLTVPANQKFKLIVNNLDDEVEEFESFDLHREKIVPARGKIKINIGQLSPGEYKFFGDFHNSTAQGVILVE